MSGGGERGYAPRQGRAGRGRATSTPPALPRAEGWRRPSRKRVRAIRDRLRELYGSRRNDPHGDPVHELVLTILSQNTNDSNRDVAYRRLRDRFDDWESIRDAPTEEVIEAIRPGGLANTKGPRIQEVLRRARPRDRPRLAARDAARAEVIDYLTSLPGRRPQDGRLRDDLRPRPARDPGRHPRPPGRRAPRAVPAADPARGRARRDARDHRSAPTPTSSTST